MTTTQVRPQRARRSNSSTPTSASRIPLVANPDRLSSVERRRRGTPDSVSVQPRHSRGASDTRNAPTLAPATCGNLATEPMHTTAPAVSANAVRTIAPRLRVKRSLFALRSDTAIIAAVISCGSVMCALGMFYVAAFSNVTLQYRTMHSLNQSISDSSAIDQMLTNRVSYLKSTQRIAAVAPKLGMISGGATHFMPGNSPILATTPTTNTAYQPHPVQVASR